MDKILLNNLGWKRDLPDVRDYSLESDEVKSILERSSSYKTVGNTSVSSIDLRRWCSPIEYQGSLGACTANAGVGLMEYFQIRAFGKYLNASRLFLYKTTRKLLGWNGDTGAYLRTTMKAMVLFGMPPEKYWPYNISDFDLEPPSFCYAFADNYKTVLYYRLDPPEYNGTAVLNMVKRFLASHMPSMFGFTVYSSIPRIGQGTGDIPFPTKRDSAVGGHAVVAVGYDDNKKIGNRKGALLIRNSWGTNWGEGGYGWLPYAYVESKLAVDFWSLLKADFVDTELFK